MNELFYVEDDEPLAEMTIRALKRRGVCVHHFRTLTEAKAAIHLKPYSHALLDLKLDDGNSLSLISKLLKAHPNLKILLLTGYASIATAVQAIKLGAHNYLAKPATVEDIFSAFGETSGTTAIELDSISLKRLEWEKIQQALLANDGNISATARQLKMHRRTLQRKLEKRPVSE